MEQVAWAELPPQSARALVNDCARADALVQAGHGASNLSHGVVERVGARALEEDALVREEVGEDRLDRLRRRARRPPARAAQVLRQLGLDGLDDHVGAGRHAAVLEEVAKALAERAERLDLADEQRQDEPAAAALDAGAAIAAVRLELQRHPVLEEHIVAAAGGVEGRKGRERPL